MKKILKNPLLRRMAIINFFYGMGQAVYAYKAVMLTESGLDAAQSGIIFSVMSILGVLAPIIGGVLADKFLSRYQVFIGAILGLSLVCAFLPLSAGIHLGALVLIMFLMPMLQLFHPVANSMIGTCSINAANRVGDTDYAFLRLWLSLGYTIATVLGTWIMDTFGTYAPCYFAVLCLGVTLLFRKTIRESERTKPGEASKSEKARVSFKPVFKNYYIVCYVVLYILYSSAQTCSSFISYVLTFHKIDASAIGLVSGLKVIGEIVIMLLLPTIKKKLSLSGLQILSGVLLCIELALLRCVSTVPLIILVEIIGGAGNGIAYSSGGPYVRKMAPEGLEATAQSIWAMGSSLGGIILSTLFGYVINRYNILVNYTVAFWIEAIWVILFLSTLLFGKYVLKKENVTPLMFIRSKEKAG